MPNRTKILRLVQPAVNADALDAALKLVEDIKSGKTIGCLIVHMHKVDEYTVDVAGECQRYRAAARGMAHALDDELSTIRPEQA